MVSKFLNVNLKSDKDQKTFYFDNNLSYDYLIWTANPIPLQVYNEKIDNEVLK